MEKPITFIYDPICPFAQRVWLTLLEKQIPFEKKRVSLKQKSQEFKDLYDKSYAKDNKLQGAVPVIIYRNKNIAESDIIVWLLSEQFQSGVELIPSDHFQRLKMRWFIKNITNQFILAFYAPKGMIQKPEADQQKIKERVIQAVRDLEKEIVGPYAMGEHVTMADLMVYPWLERFFILKETYGIEIPSECKKVITLKEIMQQRASVQETRKEGTDQYILGIYKPYFKVPFKK